MSFDGWQNRFEANPASPALSDIAVRITNLSKRYRMYSKGADRLKQLLFMGRRQYYRDIWALQDITLNIAKGEAVGIIGPNGSGKTTLLQLISGTLTPTEGEAEIRGKTAALLELGAGFNPDFTGRENVYMNASIMGLSKAEIDARFSEIADFAGIGSFIDEPVRTYSSGMYIRLAFSVAIHVSADILIIDEALSVGDIRFQHSCLEKIKAFSRQGTVIFVSHDPIAVTELCSRVIWLESGRIRMDGPPKAVIASHIHFMRHGVEKFDTAPRKDSFPFIKKREENDIPPVSDDVKQHGSRTALIERLQFACGNDNREIAYAGREAEISMIVHACEDIVSPIIGYTVKDRVGREILGDNTSWLLYDVPPLAAGRRYLLRFRFDPWPNLHEDQYSISVAISDGTMENHTHCHWLHDALVIRSVPVRHPGGIFSILNTNVSLLPIDTP